eukprot:3370760-Pleurochrysis_carterae.AAC.1
MQRVRALASDRGTLRRDRAESRCNVRFVTRQRGRCHGCKRAKRAAFAVCAEADLAARRPLGEEGRDGSVTRVVVG